MNFSSQALFWALLGGILPALIWLWFWLREDKKRPEPRGLLVFTFIGGMIAVLVVLPLEKFSEEILSFFGIGGITGLLIIIWAVIEEVVKYVFSYFTALRRRAFDEPIDAPIYLITTALGFAALENTLFLLTPLRDGSIIQSLITGNMRFIGATVLHTLASGVIGLLIGFSFYKNKKIKHEYLAVGLFLAIVLHALFNFFIMRSSNEGVFGIFGVVWVAIVVLILLLERVKRIRSKK